MLVADTILIEHLRHFSGDHVTVVRHGDQRDLLPGLGSWFGIWLFRRVIHAISIHHMCGGMLIYSNASMEERSGNCRLQPWQVTK